MKLHTVISFGSLVISLLFTTHAAGVTYEVGPAQSLASIGAVPWESLQPGDTVRIYWRSTPYHEKWVICRQGTSDQPIKVTGVPGPNGELPIIDGNGATTRLPLDYWSENRGILKIGGASIPADTMPRYIVIENLDIRAARSIYSFTDDGGAIQAYAANASAIYLEKGENITIRNCIMHDCGNGFFVASSSTLPSRNILVEGNYIYDNGNPNSAYEHNSYTAAIGIVFQFNLYGPLRAGSIGNALKDRSAGLVVRNNWIEGGNRQLDLVDGEDSSAIRNHPDYRATYVYGNVLVEPAAAGNRQIVHYGGDSGATANYRKGMLHFYNNTVISYRTDRTTLFRLSSNEERCDSRNNIIYVSAAPGNTLSIIDDTGFCSLTHNWFKPGYVPAFFTYTGSVNDDRTSITGASPGFVNELNRDFHLAGPSPCINAGAVLNPAVLPAHDVLYQYVKHLGGEFRPKDATLDLGAFELTSGLPADLVITTSEMPVATVNTSYSASLEAIGGVSPYTWSLVSGRLPSGLSLNSTSGEISGTPSQVETTSFTVQVMDSQNPAYVDTVNLSISAGAPPLQISSSSLPNARRNKSYYQTLQATGGLPPYSWSLLSGTLPPGLALYPSSGVISGKPTRLGTWSFTVGAVDAQNPPAADQQFLSIRVR